MNISSSLNHNKYFLFIVFLFILLISTLTFAQNWSSGWVYIQNVKTGLVMDVQGNVKSNGTNVWPYSLNYSNAQIFRFSQYNIDEKYGEDARYIMAYKNSSANSDLFLSIKTPPMVMVDSDTNTNEPSPPGMIRPDYILPSVVEAVGTDRPHSDKKILRNYIFSIETKREVDESPISVVNDFSVSLGQTPKQIWKILPVPNESNVYYIQNPYFKEKMVAEPLDFSSGGTLVLSSFNGLDIQKWKIIKISPEKPTNLKLSNFEWEDKLNQSSWPWNWHREQKIKGKLSWANSNSSILTKQKIIISGSSADYETITIDPNKSSFEFNLLSNNSAKKEEHCFSIKAINKWQSQNWVFSDEVCKTPASEDATPAPTLPSQAVSKLIISNCHNEKKLVRLWTYDFTTNNGTWKDHGTLGSQWQGSGCPVGSPKEINLSDNHLYRLVAIDCGNLPPNQTQATCHKLTSSQIQGGTDGASLTFQIN